MNRVSLLLPIIVAALVPVSAAKIEVDYRPESDFDGYRTWAWRKGTEAPRPHVQQWIVAAVERELAAKDLLPAGDDEADLRVSTYAVSKMDSRLVANLLVFDATDIGVLTTDVVATTKGVLVIDLVDGESDELVWRGFASEVMTLPNPDKLRRKIDKAVRKLFKQYPR